MDFNWLASVREANQSKKLKKNHWAKANLQWDDE